MRGAPDRLRCEYLNNPLGVDTARPRLSWWLNDPRPAELQTAYQIQAASAPAVLQSGSADLWDSGYVAGQQTLNVAYQGRALGSGERVWWRVRCYDSDGTPSPWSEAAWFEAGLLDEDDWRGQWIAAPLTGSPMTAVPVPLLYRDFDLVRVPASGRLYVAVLGCAWLSLNGRRVDSGEPQQPWHDPQRRAPSRVHDVTELLRPGRNRLALLLADGDYCGHLTGGVRQRYGSRPAVCAQLVMRDHGAQPVVVSTDTSWLWRPSWILRGDRDCGEEVDGRQYQPDWSEPGHGPEGYPVQQESVTVARVPQPAAFPRAGREVEAVAPPRRTREADGRTLLRYDFGHSLFGRVRLRLRASRDTTVAVRYGEQPPPLRPDAVADTPPAICWEAAADRYTCRGDEIETFEPRFALHAFRYVDIEIDREPVDVVGVAAVEIASGVSAAAQFHCDHRLLEEFFAAAARTCRLGLVLGPVTALDPGGRCAAAADLPAVLAGSAASLDVAAEFAAWLRSLGTMLDADGELPARIPGGPVTPDDAGHVESLLPALWFLYRHYGDRRLLEALYPTVQRYLAGLQGRWPEHVRSDAAATDGLRQQMLATAGYAFALSLASRMAGVLGHLADLERYESLGQQVREVFRMRFVSPGGLLLADDQLGYLLALQVGLLDGEERDAAVARLAAQLRADGFHGRVDLRYGGLLLEVLTREGRTDLAYQVMLQTSAPGWLHPLHGGADILWDMRQPRPGRLAAAVVAGWLQRCLLGLELDDDLTPDMNAYRRMRIQPRPPLGESFAAGAPVREASGYLDTVHGRYQSAWRIADDGFHLQVRVPGNCSARVVLPDASEHLIMAGWHEFHIPHGDSVSQAESDDEVPVLREISGNG